MPVQRVSPVSHRRFESHQSESLVIKAQKKEAEAQPETELDKREEKQITLTDLIGVQISKKAVAVDEREAQILTQINDTLRLTEENWQEVFRGAHVVVKGDEGRLYDFIQNEFSGVYTRVSTHASSVPQIGINLGKAMKTMLLGKTETGDSWFQLERHAFDPLHKPLDSLAHVWDAIRYFFTGKNIGPWGKSKHTDKKPLILFAA